MPPPSAKAATAPAISSPPRAHHRPPRAPAAGARARRPAAPVGRPVDHPQHGLEPPVEQVDADQRDPRSPAPRAVRDQQHARGDERGGAQQPHPRDARLGNHDPPDGEQAASIPTGLISEAAAAATTAPVPASSQPSVRSRRDRRPTRRRAAAAVRAAHAVHHIARATVQATTIATPGAASPRPSWAAVRWRCARARARRPPPRARARPAPSEEPHACRRPHDVGGEAAELRLTRTTGRRRRGSAASLGPASRARPPPPCRRPAASASACRGRLDDRAMGVEHGVAEQAPERTPAAMPDAAEAISGRTATGRPGCAARPVGRALADLVRTLDPERRRGAIGELLGVEQDDPPVGGERRRERATPTPAPPVRSSRPGSWGGS